MPRAARCQAPLRDPAPLLPNKAPGHDEDLIQQTFVACIEARDAFRGESTFRAYLFGLARFQLLTHYRKAYRRPDLDFTITSLRDIGTSPTGALCGARRRSCCGSRSRKSLSISSSRSS